MHIDINILTLYNNSGETHIRTNVNEKENEKGKGDIMKLTVLSRHVYMIEGNRNTYIISTFDNVSIMPVYNNPDNKALCICQTFEQALQFLDMVDSKEGVD